MAIGPLARAYRTSQPNNAHSASAMGNATNAPRANERRARASPLGRRWSVIVKASIPDFPPNARTEHRVSPERVKIATKRGQGAQFRLHRKAIQAGWGLVTVSSALIIGGWLDERRTCTLRERAIRLPGTGRGAKAARSYRSLLMLAALAAATARPAAAQNVNRDDTPATLFIPETGEGARIAPGFVLRPSIETALAFDSNVYNLPNNGRSDVLARLRPEVVIASDFSRHYVELRTGAEIRRYFDTAAENSETFHIDALGRLELGGHIDVVPEIGYARGVEQRGTAGDAFLTDEPVSYARSYAALSIARTVGKLGLSLKGRADRWRYDEAAIGGVPIDLSDRDADRRGASLRASYRLAESTRIFVEGGINSLDYRKPTAGARDSSGWTMLGGMLFKPSEQIDFEVAAGYLKQRFDDPLIRPVSAFNYRLAANWIPRRQWALRADIHRDVDPSPINGAAAIVRSEYRLGVQRSFGDRLRLEADAARLTENFRGFDRSDHFTRFGMTARYRINARVGALLGAGYRTQSGGRDYDGFSASVGVRVAL